MKRADIIKGALAEIERWLDYVFDGVIPGERGARIFWGSAMARTFAKPLWQLGMGISPASTPRARRHAAELAASAALLAWERARDARLDIPQSNGDPTTWLALLPGYPAANHAVPQLARGAFGVLLYGGFDVPDGRQASTEALTGLSPLRVVQTIRPEERFTSAMAIGLSTSHRVWTRMSDPPLGAGEGLIKLATIDVMRAVLADRRCRELHGRFERVYFPHASLATHAVVDAAMQRRGAITYEVVHGALGETEAMLAEARTFTSVKVLRTRIECELLKGASQTLLGGYLPQLPPPPPPPSYPPKTLLVLSNYATQPLHLAGVLPRLREQRALFEQVAVLAPHARIVWRPHPYDDANSVADTLREHPYLIRSTATLTEDVAAADAVVSTISSVLVDVALADRPVCVHTPAIHDPEDIAALLPERFETARELAAWWARIRGPDTRLRSVLFGHAPPERLETLEVFRSRERSP